MVELAGVLDPTVPPSLIHFSTSPTPHALILAQLPPFHTSTPHLRNKDASHLQSNPRPDSQVLASGLLTRSNINKVSTRRRSKLGARKVEEANSPAKVVGIKESASKGSNSQILASGQPDRLGLDEDGVFGPGRRTTAAVVVEASVDAGDATFLALGDVLLEGGGAHGKCGGEEGSEGCELHFENWDLRI